MSSEEQNPSKPFRFLDLAPELRHKIYTIIATSPQSHIDLSSTYKSPHKIFPHALLLTCTQIYHELRPLYFASNAFSITILRRNDSWCDILTPFFLDNRRQIRSLRIIIVRWGTKNFFCGSLLPALEDCILNGRLRELEVVIRDRAPSCSAPSRREYESWRMLRRVLRDPYLEKMALRGGQFNVVRNEEGSSWDLEKCKDISYLLEEPGVEQDETSIKVI
jgi:hypothetical protein